jgi:hypothetical protein
MTPFQVLIVAMAFPLAVSAMSRGKDRLATRTPPALAGTGLYLADRVDRVRFTAVLAYRDEFLVGLAADFPTELGPRAWRVAACPRARGRLEGWLQDATALLAYRSADGAITPADRLWGGNVECEPGMAVG